MTSSALGLDNYNVFEMAANKTTALKLPPRNSFKLAIF